MPKSRYSYAQDPAWSDVTPVPHEDGGPNALATIAYSDEYSETTAYLRALMAADERSQRALDLTSHLINLNPAHYTVWLYRAKLLEALRSDIPTELEWLNEVSLQHIKNYQIWHHRQVLIERFASQSPDLFPPLRTVRAPPADDGPVSAELEFLHEMLDKDTKNYHVWSYRHWLVRRFALWSGAGELDVTDAFLRHDIRNNSAWNHRWFVVFGRETAGLPLEPGAWDAELAYAQRSIRLAPQNESAWNYLRGLMRRERRPWSDLREFAAEFTGDLQDEAAVRSTFALDMLAEACADDADKKVDAERALTLLAERFDPIREKYWNYRRKKLGLAPA